MTPTTIAHNCLKNLINKAAQLKLMTILTVCMRRKNSLFEAGT